MLDLPYEKIFKIQQSITVMENLVAVLSQKNGPRILQVFNTETPPVVQGEHVRVMLLRELPDRDLTEYDGLMAGFPALDVLRDDLITKGPLFFPLKQMFFERGETAALYLTQANLSIQIMKRLREQGEQSSAPQRQWTEARALGMTLPLMLQDRQCSGLVGVLPTGELNRFILKKSCRFIYHRRPELDGANTLALDDLPGLRLDANNNWVVALEETLLFKQDPTAHRARFLELRGLLREAGKARELQETRMAMARELLQAQERIRSRGLLAEASQPYLPLVRSLVAEYWLEQSEREDLVAFLPHNDFAHFMETGDAVRVYRVLEEGSSDVQEGAGRAISLSKLIKDGPPRDYQDTLYTFPLVRLLMRNFQLGSVLPLGDLFWKIGDTHTLARSLWLLGHDVQTGVGGPVAGTQPSLNTHLDTVLRACTLYSLLDPWKWRQGRWHVYLEACYRTALAILRRAGEDLERPVSTYYRALGCWFGCALETRPEQKLHEMLERLRDFERAVRERQRDGGELRHTMALNRQLLDVVEALLRLPVSGQVIEVRKAAAGEANGWGSVAEGLRRAANFSESLPLLSTFFKEAWEYLLELRLKRQHLYNREREIDRLIRQLNSLKDQIQKRQRRLFAPAHEMVILNYAYQQEIDHIEILLRELETAAKLTVALRNPWVDLHEEVDLTLEISNLGRVDAERLEVVLEPSRGFVLLSESPVREILALHPGDSRPVRYTVRPIREDADLRISYSFSDRRGQVHKDNWSTRLTVRNLDEEPFQVKVNRYQFGRPIQEPTEFYGRRSELQNILSQLIAGGKQNLLLRGPRRMGKTSLLYMLQRALTEPDTRRFFNLPTGWDAQLDRVHPVFMSLHSFDLTNGSVAVSQFFRTLIERVSHVLGHPEADLAEVLVKYERREKEVGVVNAGLEQIEQVLDRYPEERIAVLLDEYDEVYRPEGGNLDRHLREFVSAEQRLTWIIASTLALFREVKTISSPWFNVFSIIELSRLSDDAAISLVEIPCKDERVLWRSDAVLTLLGETGRHPAFTQLFCAKVISYLNQMRTNYALDDTILTVADQIVDEQETANSHFEFYWLDTSGIGQLILLILDDHEAPLKREEVRRRVRSRLSVRFGDLPARRVPDQSQAGDPIEWQEREFKVGMEFVEKIVNAVTLDDQRRYVFTVPLFQRWLRRRRRYQDMMAEAFEKIAQEMEQEGLSFDR